ncbi:MAG: cache domain-containing protein, partial [Candidatus Dormibacteraeota bacterium]|nr:cache domain-containing protein [Candidatus Dormibacteraeota bacterium]
MGEVLMGKLGRTRLVERLWSARTSTKVLLFFIFASLIPLYGLVALTDRANSSILRAQQLENLTNRSVSLAAQIDDQLATWSGNSKQLAQDPGTIRFLSHDAGATPEETLSALRRTQATDPSFKAAFLLDTTGTVVASSDPALAGSKDLSGTQMFLQPQAGNLYISDLSIGKLAPVPAVYFAAPVRDPVGTVVGVAGLRTAPDKLFSFFRPDLLGQQRYAMLMDQYGIIIGTSGTQQGLYHSLAPLNDTQQQMLRQNQNFGNSPVQDLGMVDLYDRLQGNKAPGSTTGFFKPTNQQTVFGFAPLGTEPWQIVVAQPEAAFLAPIDQSRNNTIGFTTVAAVIIIAVIFLVARAFERSERQSLHD